MGGQGRVEVELGRAVIATVPIEVTPWTCRKPLLVAARWPVSLSSALVMLAPQVCGVHLNLAHSRMRLHVRSTFSNG